MNPNQQQDPVEGFLLIDKPKGKTSFSLVATLRKRLGVKKIGHAGTLDPFATGVMILLVGRQYTRLSDQFLCSDKEYKAQLYLGAETDTYDCEGTITRQSDYQPTLEEIKTALQFFQGTIDQVPPMYSAKKIQGKKLYELARKGIEIERTACQVKVETELVDYHYPYLVLNIQCSKGTYIRSLAYDLGQRLGCGAHLTNLQRTRSGSFKLKDCLSGEDLQNFDIDLKTKLIKTFV